MKSATEINPRFEDKEGLGFGLLLLESGDNSESPTNVDILLLEYCTH